LEDAIKDNWNVCNALVPNVELNNFATLLPAVKVFPPVRTGSSIGMECPENHPR